MMTARDIAILDMLHRGYRPPGPDYPDHDRLMAEWMQRYRVRLTCAERVLEAVALTETEEPSCPPLP